MSEHDGPGDHDGCTFSFCRDRRKKIDGARSLGMEDLRFLLAYDATYGADRGEVELATHPYRFQCDPDRFESPPQPCGWLVGNGNVNSVNVEVTQGVQGP